MNLVLSAVVGALVAVMVLANGFLSQEIGNYSASLMIHLLGMGMLVLLLLGQKSKTIFRRDVPLYMYSAGAIGLITILFSNIGFIGLGVSLTMALGLLGQAIVSIIIDHFGWFEMKVVRFEKKKYIGLGMIFAGILVMCVV
jgi:transporter family-2 protein